MIVSCECGVQYNNKTVAKCPMCTEGEFILPKSEVKKLSNEKRIEHFARLARLQELKKQAIDTEVERFLKDDIISKTKISSSSKRSSETIKQSQKLGHKMLHQKLGLK